MLSRRDFVFGAGAFSVASAPGRACFAVSGVAPLVRFGVVTDVHYADRVATSGGLDYRSALGKLRAALSVFEERGLDFVVELGDFKDNSGSVAATLEKLDEIEGVFAAFSGAHYHVLGNHDTDVLTEAEFLSHVSNTGFAAAQPYYSFVRGGVTFVVLDTNYNSDSDSDHYSRGSRNWTVAYVPPAERAWLRDALSAAPGPAVVFCHQRLDAASPADYAVTNASAVREIMETSGKVIGVFTGHQHADVRSNAKGICHFTLPALAAETGRVFEVACYPQGVSVFGF